MRYPLRLFSTMLLAISASQVHGQDDFSQYWYAGDAELSSYNLQQARYGELNQGTAVLIYVSEQLLPKEQVKADNPSEDNTTVLKLNKHKSFLTGIYPYSIMTSTFSPVAGGHALKVSNTTQEWCGNAYSQLNHRQQFEITSHSYFEGEADQSFSLAPTHLEDEIWNTIRLDPAQLPVGEISMLPAFEYIRLLHIPTQVYQAQASLTHKDQLSVYTIKYPALDRKLVIHFQREFPYVIEGWQDTYKSGFDQDAKVLTSKASRIATIKEKYWALHNNRHKIYREKLGL